MPQYDNQQVHTFYCHKTMYQQPEQVLKYFCNSTMYWQVPWSTSKMICFRRVTNTLPQYLYKCTDRFTNYIASIQHIYKVHRSYCHNTMYWQVHKYYVLNGSQTQLISKHYALTSSEALCIDRFRDTMHLKVQKQCVDRFRGTMYWQVQRQYALTG